MMAVLPWMWGRPQPRAEVIEVTTEEFEAAEQRALDALGLTYEELAEQAERQEFDSIRARKLWLIIGHTGKRREDPKVRPRIRR